jgi:hypothetical protein
LLLIFFCIAHIPKRMVYLCGFEFDDLAIPSGSFFSSS